MPLHFEIFGQWRIHAILDLSACLREDSTDNRETINISYSDLFVLCENDFSRDKTTHLKKLNNHL